MYLLLSLLLKLILVSHSTGVSIWYMYPLPGGILKNNTAISVYTMVNEIRCYSGDTTSSNDNTDIMSPPGSSSLVFSNSAAGRLVKSGSASISSVDNGIYTCVYNEEYQVSFGVYSRDREPDSDDGSKWIFYLKYALHCTKNEHVHNIEIYVCVHVHVCMYNGTCTCMYVHVHVLYTYIYIYIIYMCTMIHNVNVYMYIYICTCTYMYICTHYMYNVTCVLGFQWIVSFCYSNIFV